MAQGWQSAAHRLHTALSRATSSGSFIAEIDGLRFAAVAAVVLYHLNGYFLAYGAARTALSSVLGRGWFGVDLFFAISGFVIALPFAKHALQQRPAVRLKDYYLRRLTRIEPPYLVCITLCFVLLIIVKGESFSHLLPHYLATLTYTHSLLYDQLSPVNSVTWSLEVEVQFYLAAPLLAAILTIRSTVSRRCTWIALIGILCLVQPYLAGMPANALQFAQFFIVGMLLAELHVTDRDSTSYVGDAIGATAVLLLYWISGDKDFTHHSALGTALACFGLFLLGRAALRGRVVGRVLSLPWIAVIGGMCYTIYLYHVLVISFFGRLLPGSNPLIVSALAIPGLLVAASVLFVCLEKPFMRSGWLRQQTRPVNPTRTPRHAVK